MRPRFERLKNSEAARTTSIRQQKAPHTWRSRLGTARSFPAREVRLACPKAPGSKVLRHRRFSSTRWNRSQRPAERWQSEEAGYDDPQINKYLDAVDEFGQGDVSTMTKDVNSTEVVTGPVPELEAQKVAVVRKRATTQLNDEGRGEVSCKHTGQCLEYRRICGHTHECP